MVATIGLHHATDLSNFQSEGCIFKWLLHVSTAKVAKVSSSLTARALRKARCNFLEGIRVGFQLLQKLCNICLGLFP
jgi:hypothetical protein